MAFESVKFRIGDMPQFVAFVVRFSRGIKSTVVEVLVRFETVAQDELTRDRSSVLFTT